MKAFVRLVSALGIAAVLGATAVFAAPPPAKTTPVKAHSFMNKKGHMVNVKAHTRVVPAKKTVAVKAHSFMNKKGHVVNVKAHTRKAPMKGMKKMTPKPGGTM